MRRGIDVSIERGVSTCIVGANGAGKSTLLRVLDGLRMPSGNELGANDQWVPGGFTSGGVPEATIDTGPGLQFQEIRLGE
mgnify:CR=1 FL=1